MTDAGREIGPEKRIDMEEARCYTLNSAYANFEEHIKGSIVPGKLADLAVLSDDILTCPSDEIKDIRGDRTIVAGEIVYERAH